LRNDPKMREEFMADIRAKMFEQAEEKPKARVEA
jgi:hypothetical protein